MLDIIRPSWLKVERAIIFFMSHSAIALYPAISIVIVPIRRRAGWKMGDFIKNGENRIRRNTPAVTRVDECTRALTGVGAAIAAGSHLENGSWALFVMAATIIAKVIAVSILVGLIIVIDQWP